MEKEEQNQTRQKGEIIKIRTNKVKKHKKDRRNQYSQKILVEKGNIIDELFSRLIKKEKQQTMTLTIKTS